MGLNYNPEAIPKLKQATSDLEGYVEGKNNRIALFEEIANQSGAPKFIEQVEKLKEATDVMCDMIADFVGEDDHKAADGTMKGVLNGLIVIERTMNGEA